MWAITSRNRREVGVRGKGNRKVSGRAEWMIRTIRSRGNRLDGKRYHTRRAYLSSTDSRDFPGGTPPPNLVGVSVRGKLACPQKCPQHQRLLLNALRRRWTSEPHNRMARRIRGDPTQDFK